MADPSMSSEPSGAQSSNEWTGELRARLRGVAFDPAREMEIIEELSLHLDERVAELRRSGKPAAEARIVALAELDDITLRSRLATLRQARAPEPIALGAPQGRRISDVWRDVRLAVRLLRAKPAFAAVAMLTLALGLGANTAIFSVVHAVLLRPLPFQEPDRLVFVWSTTPERPLENLTPGRLHDFRTRAQSFAAIAGLSHVALNLTGDRTPERLEGASVSSNFFDVLGVRPLHGRAFVAEEGGRAVVLSHRLWANTFAADPSIVGRAITLNGKPHTVVGVMPASFVWPIVAIRPVGGEGPELWVAAKRHEIPDMPFDREDDMRLDRRSGYLRAVARLKDGVTRESAAAEVASIAASLQREHPSSDAQRGATVVSVRKHLIGETARPLLLILGAVAFVLLIACANVANLMMGRAAARRREFEVRLALGAGRGRLIQQLLVESCVLSLAGGLLGVLLAWWTLDGLVAAVPGGLLRLGETSLNPTVLAFAFALATLSAILFGILPAMQAARIEGRQGLRDDSRTIGHARARSRTIIVASEVAVAVALVVGASLLVRSFAALQRVDVGLDIERLVTFDLFLSGDRAQYQSKQVAFYESVLERVRAIPGVTAAGMAVTLPIGGDDFGAPITIDDRPLPPEGGEPSAGSQIVSPGYFSTVGMALIAGRDLSIGDTRERAPVAIVNQAFASEHWPGEMPIGRRFHVGRDRSRPALEVVGVVENMRHFGPASEPRQEFYVPYTQRSFPFMSVLVRAEGDPGALAGPIRQAVAALDPAQPVARLMPMSDHLRNSLAQPRFLSGLTSLFGGLALTLAAIGIYGVMAWSVTMRVKEFGVRLALGARPGVLLRQVLIEGLRVVTIGAAAGLAIAAAISHVMRSLLFDTSPVEPVVYATAATIVFMAASLAIVIPARRATKVDPIQALRSE